MSLALRSGRRMLEGVNWLCLALSLAMAAAVFALVDGLFWRPLPFQKPEELIVFRYRPTPDGLPPLAYDPALQPERERLLGAITGSGLVQSVTEVRPWSVFAQDSERSRLHGVEVDPNFFDVFGFTAMRGSIAAGDLTEALERSTEPTVVLGHGLWQRLGQPEPGPVIIERRSVNVAAILSRGAKFPGETNIWRIARVPVARVPTHGRLAAGADMEALSAHVPALDVQPLRDAMKPQQADGIFGLLVATALVVILSWVQLAGLTVAGMLARLREFGVRLSLGATPRQLLAVSVRENAAKGVLVGSAALLAAPFAIRFLTSSLPPAMTGGQYVSIDGRTIGFVGAVVTAGCAVLALSPAWVLRIAALTLLRNQLEGAIWLRVARVRRVLAIVQVAVGATLLYVTALFGHSLSNVVRYDYGFAADNVVVFEPPFPGDSSVDFDTRDLERGRLTRVTVGALTQRRGIVAAAALMQIPLTLSREYWEDLRRVGNRTFTPGTRVYSNNVGRNFVRALGATLIAGQSLDHPDNAARGDVAVVNATFARAFGGVIELDGRSLPMNVIGMPIETAWFKGTIVGVVQDLVFTKVSDPPMPQIFVPERPPGSPRYVAIRTADGHSGIASLKPALEVIWGPLGDDRFFRLDDMWNRSLSPYIGHAQLAGSIALFAVPLAAVGVASFMLFLVRAEKRSTAIRLAVGAEPAHIRRAVIRHAIATAALGVTAGAVLGALLGRFMSSWLFGVTAVDPISLSITLIVFAVVTIVTSWAPAATASRTNPAVLLRSGE